MLRFFCFSFLFLFAPLHLVKAQTLHLDMAKAACRTEVEKVLQKAGAEKLTFNEQLVVNQSKGDDFQFGWPPGSIEARYSLRGNDGRVVRRPSVTCMGSLPQRTIRWMTINAEDVINISTPIRY